MRPRCAERRLERFRLPAASRGAYYSARFSQRGLPPGFSFWAGNCEYLPTANNSDIANEPVAPVNTNSGCSCGFIGAATFFTTKPETVAARTAVAIAQGKPTSRINGLVVTSATPQATASNTSTSRRAETVTHTDILSTPSQYNTDIARHVIISLPPYG